MEEQKELQKQFRQQQEKYTYYLIALCVAAVGFSIHLTIGLPMKFSQIPLAIAVASWGGSIYCGIKFIRYVLSILYANDEYFEVQKGNHPDLGNHPEKIQAAKRGIVSAMNINVRRANCFSNWQYSLFLIGFISFLLWHILEMYYRTNCI